MMRKWLLSWAMIALVLLAQAGLVAHEVTHLAERGLSGESHEPPPAHHHCTTCLAFAGLHATALPDSPTVALLPLGIQRPVTVGSVLPPASLVDPHSRGPPAGPTSPSRS
ncbi:hypothetical protein [Rhizobacter sp. Root1221]|uniref:hypothetical protein n=1 Tax=Rhizobacter sp. Root1221 TaxID=1736433 RepID=UPI0006F60FF9|nr:hypothetical protein [Rhizobacter sp. Root1221]